MTTFNPKRIADNSDDFLMIPKVDFCFNELMYPCEHS